MKKENMKIPVWIWAVLGIIVLVIILLILMPKIKLISTPSSFNATSPSTLKGTGACVTVDEYHLKRCAMTSGLSCNNGTFYKGMLCTAKSVGTVCSPTERNTTYSGKIYLIDSCGNIANPYQESQVNNRSYWNEIVE